MPDLIDFGPSVILVVTPISSHSANMTPGRSPLSSRITSQPNEINSGIATSLVFSAWNACTYVGQISDEMVKEKESDQSYIKCIEDIIRNNDGLWFNDELITIERK